MKSLMDQIGATVRESFAEANLSPWEDETRMHILEEFARAGKPPVAQAVVGAMRLPSIEEVRQLMA